MEYIVKEKQETESTFKDFYVVDTTKDIDGNDVQIPRFIGTYSKAQLESEKQMIDSQIESLNTQKLDIDEKLSNF